MWQRITKCSKNGLLIYGIMLLPAYHTAAQTTLSLVVKPPYSSYLNDYRHLENRAIVTIVNTTGTAMQVKLAGSLVNETNGLSIRTNSDYRPSTPITIAPHGTATITANPGAMNFLDDANTTTNASDAIKQDIVRTGLLPEGVYRLCIDVIDYNTNALLSTPNLGCSSFSISQAQPPTITFPLQGQTIPSDQTAINFSWTPPIGNLAGAAIRYKLVVVEVIPGQNANDAITAARDFNANNPIINKNNLISQIYITQPPDLPLKAGRTYATQVIAADANNKLSITNQGRSEIVTFIFGDQTGNPVNLIPDKKGGTPLVDPLPATMRRDFPNQPCGQNECVPASVSNSLIWLNHKFNLGLNDDDLSIPDMVSMTGCGADGTADGWWNLKNQYCKAKGIPVKTEKVAVTERAKWKQAYARDCDIEFILDKEHAMAVVDIVFDGTNTTITVNDDVLQNNDSTGCKTHKVMIDEHGDTYYVDDKGKIISYIGKNVGYFITECVERDNAGPGGTTPGTTPGGTPATTPEGGNGKSTTTGSTAKTCSCDNIKMKSSDMKAKTSNGVVKGISNVLGPVFFYTITLTLKMELKCASGGKNCTGQVYVKGSVGDSKKNTCYNMSAGCGSTQSFTIPFVITSPIENGKEKPTEYPVNFDVYLICDNTTEKYNFTATLKNGKLENIKGPNKGTPGDDEKKDIKEEIKKKSTPKQGFPLPKSRL